MTKVAPARSRINDDDVTKGARVADIISPQSPSRGRSLTDLGTLQSAMLMMGKLQDAAHPVEHVGTLRFPTVHTIPSKWARVKNDQDAEIISRVRRDLFLDSWKLPVPTALITVYGSSVDEELKEVADELRSGLHEVIMTTGAWVTTEGVRTGVSALVGRTVADIPLEHSPVCVGFCGWHAVAGHEELDDKDGMAYVYRWDTEHSKEGALLEPHHSHYVLVSAKPDANHGAKCLCDMSFEVRSALEEALCPDHEFTDSTRGLVEDEDNIAVPKVVLVAGGGLMALRAVHQAVTQDKRPAVIVCDVPGASQWIQDACSRFGRQHGTSKTSGLTRAIVTMAVPGQSGDQMRAGRTLAAERIQTVTRRKLILPQRRKLLEDICKAHEEGVARGQEVLFFFSLRKDKPRSGESVGLRYYTTGELRHCLVRALLDNCASRCELQMDAVQLAVTWGDAELARDELAAFQKASYGKDGLMRALERSLAKADPATLRVLLDFNAAPNKVRLDRLMAPGSPGADLDAFDTLQIRKVSDVGSGKDVDKEEGLLSEGLAWTEGLAWNAAKHLLGDALKDEYDLNECAERWTEEIKTEEDGFRPADGCLEGFTVLAQSHLDWEFNYRSHYLRYRGCRALVEEGVEGVEEGVLSCNWFDLFIWAVLVRQQAMAKVLWGKVDEPLRAASVASIVCKKLAAQTSGHQTDTLMQQAETYESWAMGMMRVDLSLDEDAVAMLLMQLPRASWRCISRRRASAAKESSTDGEMKKLDKWPESPIEVAIGVGALSCGDFLALRVVRLFLTRIFCGYKFILDDDDFDDIDIDDADLARSDDAIGKDDEYFTQRTKWLKQDHMHRFELPFLGTVFVPNFERADPLHPVHPFERRFRQVVAVLSVPKIKFASHLTFSILYYVFFLYVIFGTVFPWLGERRWMIEGRLSPFPGAPFAMHQRNIALSTGKKWQEPSSMDVADLELTLELILWAWTILRFAEEFKQMYRRGKSGYEETESKWQMFAYFYSPINLMDMFNCLAVLSSMFIRLAISLTPDGFNAHTFALSLRIVQCLYALSAIFILCRCAHAFAIFESFGVLWLTMLRMIYDIANWLWVVVFISVGVGVAYTILMPGQTFEYDRPFWRPFWGLLGDFDTESIDEYFPLSGLYTLPHELAMILTWAYTFFTTILLVNLLIAKMGSTYESMQEESTSLWLRQRVELILEYKDDCDALPPPLNALSLARKVWGLPIWLLGLLSHRPTDNTVDEKRGFRIAMGPRANAYTNRLARTLCNSWLRSSEATNGGEGGSDAHMEAVLAWQKGVERKLERMEAKMTQGMAEVHLKLDAVLEGVASTK